MGGRGPAFSFLQREVPGRAPNRQVKQNHNQSDPPIHLILETKGFDPVEDVKCAAAQRRVAAKVQDTIKPRSPERIWDAVFNRLANVVRKVSLLRC